MDPVPVPRTFTLLGSGKSRRNLGGKIRKLYALRENGWGQIEMRA
jgi:hypothetical protein